MRKTTLLICGAATALVTLTACGSQSTAGSPSASGSGAAQRPHITTVADLGALVSTNADKKNSVHTDLTVNLAGMGNITATGVMRFGAQAAMDEMLAFPGLGNGGMEMRLVDNAFYMKLPTGLSQSTKPWVKVDLHGNDALAKSLGSSAQLGQQVDPTQLINKIKSAGTITSTKQDELNGQSTTHYTITVDVKKMAASEGVNSTQSQMLDRLGVSTMPFDIWVNSDNLPVRIVTKTAFDNPMTGQPAAMAMTANYTGWGDPVTIQAPPADQVGPTPGTLGGH